MDLRYRHLLPPLLALALAACASMGTLPNRQPPQPYPSRTEPGQYTATRDASEVAELRAQAAPAQAQIGDGTSESGDEHVLSAKGFVRVGAASYAGTGEEARQWLAARAHESGAERVMIYAFAADGAAPSLHAVYYVKYKLPFGATFRDLHADEREAAGGSGVRLESVIGNSPAAEANLRQGDTVLKLDGEAVRDRADFQQRLRLRMGKRITLTIDREGVTLTRLVRLGVLASEANATK